MIHNFVFHWYIQIVNDSYLPIDLWYSCSIFLHVNFVLFINMHIHEYAY